MKKLLSLLSVLTISSSAIPTTIAASFYKNENNNNNLREIMKTDTHNKKQKNNIKIYGILKNIINLKDNFFSVISLNNKIYFIGKEEIYEYDPQTDENKIVINFINDTISSLNFNTIYNKIYFCSDKGNIYEYDPQTNENKIIFTINNENINSPGVGLNNKIYFCSDKGNIYEYDPQTNENKIVTNLNETGQFISPGVVLNNKIYFCSDKGNIYEYDPQTNENKISTILFSGGPNPFFHYSEVVLNNKIYFCSNNGEVYEFNTITNKNKIINPIIPNQPIWKNVSYGVVLNNKIYFSSFSKNIYKYDPLTGEYNVAFNINDDWNFIYKGAILNDKIYFKTKNNIYEYDSITNKNKIVINLNNINSNIISLNNKIYFINNEKEAYEYEPFQLNENNIIDIKEQIRRGLYIYNKKENPDFEFKNISDINLNNLIVSPNILIEKKQQNKSVNSEKELNICPSSSSTFINNSDSEQIQNTTSCSKQLTETNTFQKMNGFSKSKSTANNDNWTAKWGGKFTFKASGSAGIPFITEGKVETAIEVSHETSWGKSKTKTITDNSTSSDTEIKTTTNTTTINVPSQPVKVPPHSKISVSSSSWTNNVEIILNYYQKIEGKVSAIFFDKNNNEKIINISIKKAMLSLLENDILPSKIRINDDDDSVNFLYDNKIETEIIMHETEIGKAVPIPLNLDKQNYINFNFKKNWSKIKKFTKLSINLVNKNRIY